MCFRVSTRIFEIIVTIESQHLRDLCNKCYNPPVLDTCDTFDAPGPMQRKHLILFILTLFVVTKARQPSW